MQDMTRPRMHIILLSLVYLEGTTCVYMYIACNVLILLQFLYSTKKIVGVCTLSRKEHSTAQTRELACTKEVLSNVTSRGTECYYII